MDNIYFVLGSSFLLGAIYKNWSIPEEVEGRNFEILKMGCMTAVLGYILFLYLNNKESISMKTLKTGFSAKKSFRTGPADF